MDRIKLTKYLVARTEELQDEYNLVKYTKLINTDTSSQIDQVQELGIIGGKLKMISEVLNYILAEMKVNE